MNAKELNKRFHQIFIKDNEFTNWLLKKRQYAPGGLSLFAAPSNNDFVITEEITGCNKNATLEEFEDWTRYSGGGDGRYDKVYEDFKGDLHAIPKRDRRNPISRNTAAHKTKPRDKTHLTNQHPRRCILAPRNDLAKELAIHAYKAALIVLPLRIFREPASLHTLSLLENLADTP